MYDPGLIECVEADGFTAKGQTVLSPLEKTTAASLQAPLSLSPALSE